MEDITRFRHKRKLLEKSTQYYYFTDEILGLINSNPSIQDFIQSWIKDSIPKTDPRFNTKFKLNDFYEVLTKDEIKNLENDIKTNFKVSESSDVEKKSDIKVELDASDLVVGTLIQIQNYGTDAEPRKYMWNNSRGEILSKNGDGSYKIRITDVKDSNVLYSKKWYDQEQKALRQRLNLVKDEFKTLKELDNAVAQAEIDKENSAIDKAREVEQKKKEVEKKSKEDVKKKEESIKRMSRRLL